MVHVTLGQWVPARCYKSLSLHGGLGAVELHICKQQRCWACDLHQGQTQERARAGERRHLLTGLRGLSIDEIYGESGNLHHGQERCELVLWVSCATCFRANNADMVEETHMQLDERRGTCPEGLGLQSGNHCMPLAWSLQYDGQVISHESL